MENGAVKIVPTIINQKPVKNTPKAMHNNGLKSTPKMTNSQGRYDDFTRGLLTRCQQFNAKDRKPETSKNTCKVRCTILISVLE